MNYVVGGLIVLGAIFLGGVIVAPAIGGVLGLVAAGAIGFVGGYLGSMVMRMDD